MSDLGSTIETAAGDPKKVVGDAATVEQHPLKDVIAADNHLATVAAMARPHRGLRFTKMRASGATSR